MASDAALDESERKSYKITIRWFLGYCRRTHRAADFDCARDFIVEVEAERRPGKWALEQWKEGIRWFFRNGPKRGDVEVPADKVEAGDDAAAEEEEANRVDAEAARRGPRGPVPQPARLKDREPGWVLMATRGLRIRQMAYNTEKTYLHWLSRFARYWKTQDLEALGETEIQLYLDHLAMKEKVAGGTQRLALNALVFFYRDVLKRQLGDFSDYKQASGSKRVPVVLSVDELRRVLGQMAGPQRLMAQLQYGSGLAP